MILCAERIVDGVSEACEVIRPPTGSVPGDRVIVSEYNSGELMFWFSVEAATCHFLDALIGTGAITHCVNCNCMQCVFSTAGYQAL